MASLYLEEAAIGRKTTGSITLDYIRTQAGDSLRTSINLQHGTCSIAVGAAEIPKGREGLNRSTKNPSTSRSLQHRAAAPAAVPFGAGRTRIQRDGNVEAPLDQVNSGFRTTAK